MTPQNWSDLNTETLLNKGVDPDGCHCYGPVLLYTWHDSQGALAAYRWEVSRLWRGTVGQGLRQWQDASPSCARYWLADAFIPSDFWVQARIEERLAGPVTPSAPCPF